MAKRVAIFAQLHDGFFLPVGGQFDKTLPPKNKTLPNFSMFYQEETGTLILQWAGNEFVLGAANVKAVQLVPEVEAKVSAPKVSKAS